MSRQDWCEDMGIEIKLPDAGGHDALVQAASDFGFVKPFPMGGEIPVGMADLGPFVGAPLSPINTYDDAQLVAQICAAYASGRQDAKSPFSKLPWER